MPNWLWFLLGVATGLAWFGGGITFLWWRMIVREKRQPMPATPVDEVIVRDIGTLTYSQRN